jgi:hypothetical protein
LPPLTGIHAFFVKPVKHSFGCIAIPRKLAEVTICLCIAHGCCVGQANATIFLQLMSHPPKGTPTPIIGSLLGWEFQFLAPISGTPIGSSIPILFLIPKIPVEFFF